MSFREYSRMDYYKKFEVCLVPRYDLKLNFTTMLVLLVFKLMRFSKYHYILHEITFYELVILVKLPAKMELLNSTVLMCR